MRVAQINSVYGRGSTGNIVRNLHTHYLENGIDSYVFFGRGTQSSGKNLIKFSNQADVLYHGLQTRFFDRHGLVSKTVTRNLIKSLNELNPDIIHLHNIHGYYLNYPTLFNYLKKDFKGQVIWTMHDCWAFTGHCAYYTYAQCNKWETHCHNCPQKKEYPKSLYKDNSFENYELKKDNFSGLKHLQLITPSKWLKNQLSKSFLSDYNVKVLNNGVDKSIFKPFKSKFKESNELVEKKIILGAANIWEKRKGLKYLIALLEHLNYEEHIIVVGKSKFLDTFTHPKLTHIGQTSNAYELADLYNAADVYFNPTLEDNFPTTNLESIACGTPVVTFNNGGSSETIDNIISKSINNTSATENLEKLREVYSEKEDHQKITMASQIKSMSDFNKSYFDFYHEIVV